MKNIQKKVKKVLFFQQFSLHFCIIKIYPDMNYSFYSKFLFVFGLLAVSFSYTNAQCVIDDVVVTPSDCDGEYFEVTINFNYDNEGNEGFKVQGNGENYGNFEYADLPITIGPLLGDGTTNYEFVVKDNQFSDCTDFAVLGPIDCGAGACEIYDLVLETSSCDGDGNYNLWIDFNVNNPTHTHFDVIYDGDVVGYFALADLPVKIENFEDNGENYPLIKVCINDNDDCCSQEEFENPNCNQGNCEIWDLEVTNVECDGDYFYITLNFNYANVGNDGFKVHGNGMDHGTWSYADLPITIGPLPANGTFWEFVVKDVQKPDCSDFIEYGEVDCNGGDCNIYDLVVETGDCKPDGTYKLWIDFEYSNPGNDFFEVFYEGDLIDVFPLNELPVFIEDFEDNGEPGQVIKVCINDVPDCCEEVDFMSPCNGSNCEMGGFFAEAHDCDDDGFYLLDFEFDYANVGDDGFKVFANGEDYGPFGYGEPYYTIGPLEGGVVYEIVIKDVNHPDLFLVGRVGAKLL